MLRARIARLDSLIADIKAKVREDFYGEENGGNQLPRVLKLSASYELSEAETDLLHLLTVVQGSQNPHVLNTVRKILSIGSICT